MLTAIGHGLLILAVIFFNVGGGRDHPHVNSHTNLQPPQHHCGSFCYAVFVTVIIFGVCSLILVLFTCVMQLGAINENSSSYELFYPKEKILTIINPQNQTRMSIDRALHSRDALGNVAMYFEQWTQPRGWDCINAGRELIPTTSMSAKREADEHSISVRTIV
jgi:hypothetical protein